MKKLLFLGLTGLMAAFGSVLQAQTDWIRVAELMDEGSYKSAYSEAEKAFAKATDSPELLTAAWYMAEAASYYQEDSHDSAMARYRTLLPRLEAPERAVCYSFLGMPDSALADEALLKQTSSDRIRRFCEAEANNGVNLTPTVYDVIVWQIIANTKYRVRPEEFFGWYRRLIDFHSGDAEELRLCLDIEMLDAMNEMQYSYEKYDAQLIQSYINKYRGSLSPHLADLYGLMAMRLRDKDRLEEAVSYCDTAIALAPQSHGGVLCADIKAKICAVRIVFDYLKANSEAYPGRPSLHSVAYWNLDTLFFSVYPYAGQEMNKFFARRPEPVQQWRLAVEDNGSHQMNGVWFEVPALAAGRYLLVATPDGKEEKSRAYIELSCTDMKIARVGNTIQLFDGGSGNPIVGQRVDFCANRKSDIGFHTDYTDNDGRVDLKKIEHSWYRLKIERNGYEYDNESYSYNYNAPSTRPLSPQTKLMTDRPLYRPGDTVHCAVLLYETDRVDGRVIPEAGGLLLLSDPNYKTVDSLPFTTDRHGMVSALFVVPADGLAGHWTLTVKGERNGKQWSNIMSIVVEAYKPPKFMISLDEGQGGEAVTPQFGKPYTLRGMAHAYSGASLVGAQVRYTIERIPYHYRYGYLGGSLEESIVASDTLEVSADGSFDITFTPMPDTTVDRSLYPVFHYRIAVEVTDLNGEIHEDYAIVHIGYDNRALILGAMKSETTSLQSISYSLSDHNDNPIRGTVTVSVQRLAVAEPLLCHPVTLFERNYRHTLTREQFRAHYPGFAYSADELDLRQSPSEWTYTVSHSADGIAAVQTVSLPEKDIRSGLYRVVVSLDDLADTSYTLLTLPDERRVKSTRTLFWSDLSSSSVQVGDRLTLRYGSAFDDVRIFYILAGPDGKERDSRWLPAASSIKRLSIPVDTSLLGGFTLTLTAVKNGVVLSQSQKVSVPFSHKELDMEIATFRDRLLPGQEEEWTIKVDNARRSTTNGQRSVRSTIVMTMFDDALSSYGYSGTDWNLRPWRGNYGFGEHNWLMYRTVSSDFYDYVHPAIYYVGKSYATMRFTLQQGFHSRYVKHKSYVTNAVAVSAKADSNASGVLKGIVTDSKTDDPLPFVNVIVKQNGKNIAGGATDFDGAYTIKYLPEGSYDIEIYTVGYQRYVRNGVKVKKTGFTVLDVELTSTATNLECVEIAEEKVPVIEIGSPEQGQRMSSEDIAHMPGNSVDAIVATVGGVGYSDGAQHEVQVRTNLSPSAFFVAGLHTDSAGTATYRFTVPEVLTRWKVKALAYTDDLKSGELERTLVTQKPLMVQPNVPRFLRQGDSLAMMAKVMIVEPKDSMDVSVTFRLVDAATGIPISVQYQKVKVKDAKRLTFDFRVPKDVYVVTYEITAAAEGMSDGERGQIPVVTDRQAVTLSQPVYINGSGEKSFHFPLSAIHTSTTATPHFLAAELTADPVWLAVKAMPYLKQQENPSSLYIANSLYVNTLAKKIIDNFNFQFSVSSLTDTANTRLKINEDVKQTLLEATPWLRDAEDEVEQRQAIAAYFDSTRLNDEFSRLVSVLSHRQNDDGGWSWMPEGESSPWTTMQILKRISILRPSVDSEIKNALAYIDREEQRHYEKYIKPYLKKAYKWEPDNIDYLYTRSFYGKGKTDAYKFYYTNALKNYRKYKVLYTQAQLALIFQRHGDKKAARDIIRRIKEKSLQSDEMGMYWRDNRSGWCWYERPIETQALLIQAFREVTPRDTLSIALMQQWLLKQKQTTRWESDRATVDAIAALMPMGKPKVAERTENQISMTVLDAPFTAPSEGLEGYHSQRWTGTALDTILARQSSLVTLKKETPGIAWGAVYFQYTDDMDKIPSTESGITLKRTYTGTWKVGSRIHVRIDIRCDRTMEYLELIDGRPSCVEPLSTRSGWCWNDGLSYYVEVKNTATHCYVNRLEKGNYVVEYDVYVTNPGTFLGGPVTMQCMYAPEFRASAPAERFSVD